MRAPLALLEGILSMEEAKLSLRHGLQVVGPCLAGVLCGESARDADCPGGIALAEICREQHRRPRYDGLGAGDGLQLPDRCVELPAAEKGCCRTERDLLVLREFRLGLAEQLERSGGTADGKLLGCRARQRALAVGGWHGLTTCGCDRVDLRLELTLAHGGERQPRDVVARHLGHDSGEVCIGHAQQALPGIGEAKQASRG